MRSQAAGLTQQSHRGTMMYRTKGSGASGHEHCAVEAHRDSMQTLRTTLLEALGPQHVLDDLPTLEFMGTDLYRAAGRPALVLRPTSVPQVQLAVRICAEQRVAMVPRSGGASYTDGYLQVAGGPALFDLSGLDSIEVDESNAVVTVGPGATWAAASARMC